MMNPIDEPFAAFVSGMNCIFDDYDVLNAVIHNGWAGSLDDSLAKKQDMIEELTELFLKKKQNFEVHEIEDLLKSIMSEDFCINVEDGSLPWISRMLYSLYTDCMIKSDFSGLEIILTRHEIKKASGSNGNSSIDVLEMDSELCDDDAMDAVSDEEFVQPSRSKAPVMDEDGWFTVSRSK